MASTLDQLDAAISAHSDHMRDRDEQDPQPVLAWVVIATVDDNGDEETGFSIIVPDGQRGFATRGLLVDALDAIRVTATTCGCEGQ